MKEVTKDEAYKIGQQLCYDKQFFKELETAWTDSEIQKCLTDARHRWR